MWIRSSFRNTDSYCASPNLRGKQLAFAEEEIVRVQPFSEYGFKVAHPFGNDHVLRLRAGLSPLCSTGFITVPGAALPFPMQGTRSVSPTSLASERVASLMVSSPRTDYGDLELRIGFFDVFDEQFVQYDLSAVVGQVGQGFRLFQVFCEMRVFIFRDDFGLCFLQDLFKGDFVDVVQNAEIDIICRADIFDAFFYRVGRF